MCKLLTVLVYLRESMDRYRERLTDTADVRYVFCSSEEDVQQAALSADIVLGSITFPVRHLLRARCLRWVQVTAAGVDRFLLQGELPDGVVLTRVDVGFGDAISEYVLAHLMAQTQRLRDVYRLQRERTWVPLITDRLAGRTMGIAGTGAIGCVVAERARALGVRTLGWARTARSLPSFDAVYGADDIDPFLKQLDVLVVCLPLTRETRGRFGTEELHRLKPGCTLINVSRGEIVRESALLDAVRSGHLRYAILDVFEQEPLPLDHPFWSLSQVTVTGHHAGLNVPDDIIDFFLENLERYQSGASLRGRVDLMQGY